MVGGLDLDEVEQGIKGDAVRHYFFGGAGNEVTLRKNRVDWDEVALVPRVLRDVSQVDLSVELFGKRVPVPVVVAPMAYLSMIHPRAETVLAQSAARFGLSFCLSTRSAVPLEEVAMAWAETLSAQSYAGAARPLLLLQLYVMRDRRISSSILERAVAAGFDALVVTVDVPYVGVRRKDRANRLRIPDEFLEANVAEELEMGAEDERPVSFGGGVSSAKHWRLGQDPAIGWQDIVVLRDSAAPLPVVLKGILDPADLELAALGGFAGIVVSNHGGRQLDGALSTPRSLHSMRAQREEFSGSIVVDGSIESGSDVCRALGIGANGVMVGRLFARALLEGGAHGLDTAMELLMAEVGISAGLMGLSRLGEMGWSQVRVPSWW